MSAPSRMTAEFVLRAAELRDAEQVPEEAVDVLCHGFAHLAASQRFDEAETVAEEAFSR